MGKGRCGQALRWNTSNGMHYEGSIVQKNCSTNTAPPPLAHLFIYIFCFVFVLVLKAMVLGVHNGARSSMERRRRDSCNAEPRTSKNDGFV